MGAASIPDASTRSNIQGGRTEQTWTSAGWPGPARARTTPTARAAFLGAPCCSSAAGPLLVKLNALRSGAPTTLAPSRGQALSPPGG